MHDNKIRNGRFLEPNWCTYLWVYSTEFYLPIIFNNGKVFPTFYATCRIVFLPYFDQAIPNYGTFLFWAIFNHIAALIPGSYLHFILKMPTYVIHMGVLQWNQFS